MNILELLTLLSIRKPEYVGKRGELRLKVETVDITESGYMAGEGTIDGDAGWYLVLHDCQLVQWWSK